MMGKKDKSADEEYVVYPPPPVDPAEMQMYKDGRSLSERSAAHLEEAWQLLQDVRAALKGNPSREEMMGILRHDGSTRLAIKVLGVDDEPEFPVILHKS
jgi:hypothetical protein